MKNILALEFKDAEETDPAAIVTKALAGFQIAFDDRLKVIETKTADDAKLRARVPHLRIVVDAGHGGWDMGTVGRQGLLEKDLARHFQNPAQLLQALPAASATASTCSSSQNRAAISRNLASDPTSSMPT